MVGSFSLNDRSRSCVVGPAKNFDAGSHKITDSSTNLSTIPRRGSGTMGFHSMSKRMFSTNVLPSTNSTRRHGDRLMDSCWSSGPLPDGMSTGEETSAIATGSIRATAVGRGRRAGLDRDGPPVVGGDRVDGLERARVMIRRNRRGQVARAVDLRWQERWSGNCPVGLLRIRVHRETFAMVNTSPAAGGRATWRSSHR